MPFCPSPLRDEGYDIADYAAATTFKHRLLEKACQRFRLDIPDSDCEHFCTENAFYIEDHALFRALSPIHANVPWDPFHLPLGVSGVPPGCGC